MSADDFSALFRSTDEQVQPIDATVSGVIPDWLEGSLLRLGPGKFDISKEFTLNHWFDGFAVVCKFTIKDGKVQYSKRFLQTDAYKKAMSVGRPVFTEFGTKAYPDPCKNIFSRMVSTVAPELTDNVSLNLVNYEDTIFATTESGALRRIDTNNLETGEKVDMTKLVGVNLASSHSYKDEEGNIYTLGTSLMTGFKYHVIKLPKSNKSSEMFKKATIAATIPCRWKTCVAYYHSFGMTAKWIVFIEQPMQVNGIKLLSAQIKAKSMRECIEWAPHEMNLFHVLDKTTGKLLPIKYKSDSAFCVFHHINTYEENGQLVVDIIGQDSPEIIDKLFLKNLRMSEFNLKDKSAARRFVLPLSDNIQSLAENKNLVTLKGTKARAVRCGDTVKVSSETMTAPGYELPTINMEYMGKPYRYLYVAGTYDRTEFRNSVVKVDVVTHETRKWSDSVTSFPGEVQFIRRPGGSGAEDDGVLVTTVTELAAGRPDFLVILDAADLKELARAEVTAHVPNLTHGMFLAA